MYEITCLSGDSYPNAKIMTFNSVGVWFKPVPGEDVVYFVPFSGIEMIQGERVYPVS